MCLYITCRKQQIRRDRDAVEADETGERVGSATSTTVYQATPALEVPPDQATAVVLEV